MPLAMMASMYFLPSAASLVLFQNAPWSMAAPGFPDGSLFLPQLWPMLKNSVFMHANL